MEGPAMLEQTRWSEAPEMPEAAPPSRGDARGRSAQGRGRVLIRGMALETDRASERELFVGSSQEDFLLPRRRGTSILAALPGLPSAAVLVACVVVLGAVAGLLTTRWPSAQATRGGRGGLSLVMHTKQDGNDAALSQKAVRGQAFLYMSPEDAEMMVEGHMVILDPETDFEDLHRIEKVFKKTGALQLYHGILFDHQEEATVKSVPPTEEVLQQHDEIETAQFVRFTKPVESADPPGGTKITMREGCDDFAMGDEVELASKDGHFEANMFTRIDKKDDGTCEIHLTYPIDSKAMDEDGTKVSKMIHKDDKVVLKTSTQATTKTTTTEATADEYDCEVGLDKWETGWSKAKKDWCCEKGDAICKFDCEEGLDKWETGWSEAKTEYCCEKGDAICKFDCEAGLSKWESAWSKEKKDWCCTNAKDGAGFCEDDSDDEKKSSEAASSHTTTSTSTTAAPVSTTLSSAVSAGDTTLPVASTVGFSVGCTVEIEGGGNSETGVVASIGNSESEGGGNSESEGGGNSETARSLMLTSGLTNGYPPGTTTVTLATTGEQEPSKSHGPNPAVVVSAIVVGFSVIGIVLFFLGNFSANGDYKKAKPDLGRLERWAQNPPSAIVVPGGGLSRDGSLVPWVQARLKRAIEVYDEVSQVKTALQGGRGGSCCSSCCGPGDIPPEKVNMTTYIVTMCEGIRYSPRDPRGNRAQRLESQLSFDFLREQVQKDEQSGLGLKSSDIITDDLSLDTLGNAYFLRTTHTDVFKARSLVVITNEFHMKRTKAIFEKVFGLGPFFEGNSKYTVVFEQVENVHIEPAALKRRVEWEDQQLKDFERVSKDWRDLHDVHSFIFSGEGTTPKPLLDRSPSPPSASPQSRPSPPRTAEASRPGPR